jgi:transposase
LISDPDKPSPWRVETSPITDLRQQFNAVLWRLRTGGPWRDLPEEYGPWSTVYDRFRSWATAGVFEQLMQAMIAEAAARGQADLDLVSVDSTTARAHHHAAGMVLDGEPVTALQEACGQEKRLRQRGKPPERRRRRRRRTSAVTTAAPNTSDGSQAGSLSGRAEQQGAPGG